MVWPERKASDISRAVGDVIYGAYKRQRLSQADLVERTGISVTTMRRLIAGEAEFDVDQLVRHRQRARRIRPGHPARSGTGRVSGGD